MKLQKELGFSDVFSIASGAMISSGIFVLPGIAFAYTGPSVFLAYFLSGLLALTGVLSVIELSTAMPKAGGDYFFITRSLGPMVGTVSGLLSWLAIALKSAFAIFGLSEIIFLILHGALNIPLDNFWTVRIISISFCIIFATLNAVGVKEAGKLEVFLVIGLLILMGVYIIIGFSKINIEHFFPFVQHWEETAFASGIYEKTANPGGVKDIMIILSTSGMVFVSFGGLLKVSSMAEEIRNPKVNIPLALISSVVAITLLYSALLIITVGILPGKEFAGSVTPLASAAEKIIGFPGFVVLSVAAVLAFITTANAGVMAASRYPFALSRDGLLPPFLSNLHAKLKTPVVAIGITSVLMITALFLPLEILVKAASTVILTSYILANISVVVLRESNMLTYRPTFKTPFYPIPQILSAVLFVLLIIDMGLTKGDKATPLYFNPIAISLTVVIFGILTVLFYGRGKKNHEFALLQIIEKVTNKVFTHHKLAGELRDIIHERDEVSFDRFDIIIKDASIIDIEEEMDYSDFFKKAGTELSNRLSIDEDKAYELLEEREGESSTVISNFVAIPHIVVDGEKKFALIIGRSKEGIKFPKEEGTVNAVFVLAGTKDERNFHLKSISAIAQIIQDDSFEKDWLSAKNSEYLKDILLLGNRKRGKH